MEWSFKSLDEFEAVTDDVVSRYAGLTSQLKNKQITISLSEIQDVYARPNSELLLFMYDTRGTIVAMAQVSFLCVPLKPVGYINGVVVDEKYRGHGLGSILMEELQARAIQRWPAIKCFNLTSSPQRGTQGFYARLGYRARTKDAGDETIFYVKDIA